VAEVKFCGLTRAADARAGAALGAAYLGVVFAGGPRRLTPHSARVVLDGAVGHGASRRVGVFGAAPADEIAEAAAAAALDVIQLHASLTPPTLDELRRRGSWAIWRVVRVRAGEAPPPLRDASAGVDAVVVDAYVETVLGGTGVALDWEALARSLDQWGRPPRLVLAGGLNADNVSRAVGLVAPDVVDVSSGIESAVGLKDHEKMRAFAVAATRGGR
jgi:phosphoribosylanthranilate isomerase